MLRLRGKWWTFVVRGIVAIAFGLLAAFLPGVALLTLIFMFGIFMFADGILSISAAIATRRIKRQAAAEIDRAGAGALVLDTRHHWWALLIQGIVSLIAGLIALLVPGLTAIALVYVIAVWALVSGVLEIIAAIRLRKQIRGEWLLALGGVLSIVFGVFIALFPGAGALAMVIFIGAYAIVIGAVFIALGIRIRQWAREVDQHKRRTFAAA